MLLRDFDGTQTVYPAKAPLPELIRTGDEEEGILVTHRYVKSEERDPQGRIVYLESH